LDPNQVGDRFPPSAPLRALQAGAQSIRPGCLRRPGAEPRSLERRERHAVGNAVSGGSARGARKRRRHALLVLTAVGARAKEAVLISHPHAAAFAVGAAGGFARSGRLARFVTGGAASAESWQGHLAAGFTRSNATLRNRILVDFPADRLQALSIVELGARGFARLARRPGKPARAYNALFTAHDAAVSLIPWPRQQPGSMPTRTALSGRSGGRSAGTWRASGICRSPTTK